MREGDFRDEKIIIRGIIDGLFATQEGMVIVDYKTDKVDDQDCMARAQDYRIPLSLYRRGVEAIVKKSVVAAYLYFLQPAVAIDLSGTSACMKDPVPLQ